MTNTKNKYCNNCGKYGHVNKLCTQPTTSLGILCFKFSKQLNINYLDIEKYISKNYIKIDSFNFEHINNILKMNYIKNKIKFLLVRRNNTLNYIEFVRGKYNKNNLEKLVTMFELMTADEINIIKNNDFDYIWNNLWKKTSNHKIYQKEYNKSKNKFNELKKSKKLEKLLKIKPLYSSPEWGIPKGRRNNYESNIDCAKREFYEETNMDINKYKILSNLHSIQENYLGTNGIEYRHIYYLSITDSNIKLNRDFKNNCEIGDIGWFTWEECINLIRPYYKTKIELINKIFLLIINILFEYKNNKSIDI